MGAEEEEEEEEEGGEEIRWRFRGGSGFGGGILGARVEVEAEEEVDLAQGSFRGMLGPVWGVRCAVVCCAEFEFEIARGRTCRGVTPSETVVGASLAARHRHSTAHKERKKERKVFVGSN